jgi:hypothetical protein
MTVELVQSLSGVRRLIQVRRIPQETLSTTCYRFVPWQSSARARMGAGQSRTFTMDPEQGPPLFPVFEDALGKPGGCSTVMTCLCNVVIFRWIWRFEPTSDLLLQLLPCHTDSASKHTTREITDKQTFHLVYLIGGFLHVN